MEFISVHTTVACVADALNLLDYTKGLDECMGRLQRRLMLQGSLYLEGGGRPYNRLYFFCLLANGITGGNYKCGVAYKLKFIVFNFYRPSFGNRK